MGADRRRDGVVCRGGKRPVSVFHMHRAAINVFARVVPGTCRGLQVGPCAFFLAFRVDS